MAAAQAQWTSRSAFLLASIGFAVGLGNIWRFPYVTGENGGAVFIAVYLVCVFAIAAPIMVAELLIGRRGGGSPSSAMAAVAGEAGASTAWGWVGRVNLLAAFAIVVTYCVVAGWVLYYFGQALIGEALTADAALAQARFDGLLADPGALAVWTLVGLGLTGVIIGAGLTSGIERAVRILMPTLFLLMLGIAFYNVFAGGFADALAYLLSPDISKLSGGVFLAAISQAFFSVGVAMAGMMVFGAYLPRDYPIGSSVLVIVTADTVVALTAGLVVFPAVFQFGLDPAGGPGLIFQTLPVAFAQMPAGSIVAGAFFLLLSVAAVTSMVGLVEPLARSTELAYGVGRRVATAMVLGLVTVCAAVSILAYNRWSDARVFGSDLNTAIDFVSNQLLLPVGGLLIAVCAGWVMSRSATRDELHLLSDAQFSTWRVLIRYVSPPAVLLILVWGVL